MFTARKMFSINLVASAVPAVETSTTSTTTWRYSEAANDVDIESGRTAAAYRAWQFPRVPDRPTASEVDTSVAWRLLGECVGEALGAAGAAPEQIAGIAATSMRHASALLDANGDTLLATSNQDARGLAEASNRLFVIAGEPDAKRRVPTRKRTLWLSPAPNLSAPNQQDLKGIASAIERHLRQFPYTLDLPAPPAGREITDYFLFELQRGYCDYYASSMVFRVMSVH